MKGFVAELRRMTKLRQPFYIDLGLLILCAYSLVFMEWLFFATKQSFLDLLTRYESISIMLLVGLTVSVVASLILVFITLVCSAFSNLDGRWRSFLLKLPACIILTILAMTLADNFFYTIFKIGIKNSNDFVSTVLLLLMLYVLVRTSKRLSAYTTSLSEKPSLSRMGVQTLAASLWALSAVILIGAAWNQGGETQSDLNLRHGDANQPNIIFFAADGVEARLTSFYGYRQNTTPNLDRFKDKALTAENAYTNNWKSTGAIASILTGKLPTTLRAWGGQHALREQNTSEHLPGILKDLGYKTYQLGIRRWVDANMYNMQNAFDLVNEEPGLGSSALVEASSTFDDASLLAIEISERITARVLHITHISKMRDDIAIVRGEKKHKNVSDTERINLAINYLEKADAPVFIQIHLMGTHCCSFQPRIRKFWKKNEPQTDENKGHRYLDTIYTSDDDFGKLVKYLETSGKMDNTIIVYYSDHGYRWATSTRVPLAFLFPKSEHIGAIEKNTQIIDIPPTILDYLRQPIPDWMEGQSLLREAELEEDRKIFQITGIRIPHSESQFDTEKQIFSIKMPGVSLLVCDKWFAWKPEAGKFFSGKLDRSAPCRSSKIPTEKAAADIILDHLQERRYFELLKS